MYMKTRNKKYHSSAIIAILVSMTGVALAGDATPPDRFGLGLSVHAGATEYNDNDTGNGSLFAIYHGERINVDDGELAFNFLPNQSLDLEALLKRQHFGYEAEDSKVFTGMADRHQVWGVGARLTLPTKIGRFRTAAFHNPIDDKDVKNAESGSSVNLEYGYQMQAGAFQITPVVGVHWMSEEVTDFLYGVSDSEVTTNRSRFNGEDASIGYIGVEAEGMISENIRLSGGVRFESLPDEIANSPIVEDDTTTRAHIGIAWMF